MVKKTCSILSILALILATTACNNQTAETEPEEFAEFLTTRDSSNSQSKLSGTVKLDGSSTVFPVSEVMATEFRKAHPKVKVVVAVSGTGGGFKKFCTGETDIANASRPINATEMELCKKNNVEYTELPIAFDGLSVVVNPQNSFARCLKVEELKQMWQPAADGKVTTWNQIRSDFPNQPLALYGADKESGTYDYFTQAIVGAEGKSRSDYTASADDETLVKNIAANPNGIGYFGYAYYLANRDKLKLVAIDSGYGCVQPSARTVGDSSYQPLSRPVFIYVKKLAAARPEVKAFTNFYLEPENSKLVLSVGYVPLPRIALQSAKSRFNRGQTGTIFGGKGSVVDVQQQEL